MVRSEAVNTFVASVGATKENKAPFTRYNLFLWKGVSLIIKGDDAGEEFWGVPAKLYKNLDHLKKDYAIVLLGPDGTSGWFFTGSAFSSQVKKGRYKVAQQDGRDFKVSGQIDGANRFEDLKEFYKLIGIKN